MAAEAAVADLLRKQGYQILSRNWKTRVCEIDIVAQKKGVVYFVEVKYRGNHFQGDGFEYITRQKLHKMNFAADIWRQKFDWRGDYRLLAAAVTGSDSADIELVEVG